MAVAVGQVGAKLPRAHLALQVTAGRPGQDAHLLEQGNDSRHFHHKNE